MEEMKLCSVSDRYIDYLRGHIAGVYSNKEGTRTHTRKYLGVVYTLNDYNYYIPLSSPKETDYEKKDGKKIIRKSRIPIMRIVVKNDSGEDELKGTLRLSHMIPVPSSELELYDVDAELDSNYKDLVMKEIIFIRKNKDKIKKNAALLYKQKCENYNTGYIKTVLDFKILEQKLEDFIKEIV